MQIIKPMRMSLISKTYGYQGHIFAVGVLSFFKLGKDNGLLNENQQWPRISPYLANGLMLDMGFAKPCGEILVTGKAYAPDKAVKKMQVSLTLDAGPVGKINKSLQVVGNRQWDGGFFSLASHIKPFESMPLGYAHAYGGIGHPENPLGKGVVNQQQKDPDSGLYALPNVYLQQDSTKADRGYRMAASFEPLDISWPQRSKFQGAYDEKWLKTTHPGLPDDTDTRLFNAAPLDQQIKGFFNPGDTYQIKGMHPQWPLIEGQLPNVRARVFVCQKIDGKEQFKEIQTVIDTVWFFPELELGVAIHRGTLMVNDSDGLDIKKLMMAYEGADDKPRPTDYFEKVLSLRLDPATAVSHLLNESQLMPQKSPEQVAQIEALYADAKAQQQQKNQTRLAAQVAWLKEQNPQLDSIELPATFEDPDIDEFPPLPQLMIDNADIDLSPYLEKAQSKLDAAQAKADEIVLQQQDTIKDQVARLHIQAESVDSMHARVKQVIHVLATDLADDVEIDLPGWLAYTPMDPGLVEQMKQAQLSKLKAMRQARQTAPLNTVLQQPLPDKGAAQLRSWAIALLDQSVSLAGRDLAGADLSGMDFSGQDLRDIMLEKADLSGCLFDGCTLDGAVFTEANLHYTSFVGCSMQQANLALSHGKKTRFTGADLTQAIFTKGRFISCDFNDVTLDKVQALEVDFSHSTFLRMQCDSAQFIQVILDHCDCSHGHISNSILLQTHMTQANWQQMTLTRLMILKTTANGTNFCGCEAQKVQFSNEGDFNKADISAGKWHTCGFRGLDLTECDATATVFEQCDFGETKLNHARLAGALFNGCVMALAIFDHSDCQQVLFNQSRLRKCQFDQVDMRYCELYHTDLTEVEFTDCQTDGMSQQPQPSIG